MESIFRLNPRLLFVNHIGQGNMPSEGSTFGWRVTRWHELDIITWGDGIDNVFAESYPVRAGDVFYRTPGLANKHDLPYHCYFFVFDPFYLPEHEPLYQQHPVIGDAESGSFDWNPIEPFSFSTCPYLGKARDLSTLSTLALNLFLEFTSQRRDELRIKMMFLQLLYEVRQQLQAQEYHAGGNRYELYRQRVTDVRRYIADHPSERFTLTDMAARASVSPNFFCKVFRELSGETLVNYINRMRVDYIKLQLLDSEKTVHQIADECGFGDPNYLYALFRRQTGMTPMEYRKRLPSFMYGRNARKPI